MRLYVITLLSLTLISLGCSDSGEPLQGWKESEVEVVNEGPATGTTGQVVISGDAASMTATSLDTTTDLDMISDEQLGLAYGTSDDERDGEPGQRSLAERFDSPSAEAQRDPRDSAPRRSTAQQRHSPTTTQTPAARPTTARQSRPQPSEPEDEVQRRPAERPEAGPADRSEPGQKEDLPPVVVPPPEPEPPSDESRDTPPPSNDTSQSDTSPDPDREPDPPDDEESDEESE